MSTFKKIILWISIMAVFTVGGEFVIHHILETNYRSIEYKAEMNDIIDIGVDESKATKIDGYTKLLLTNKSSNIIEKTYIVLEGFSKYDNNLVKEYIEINNLEPNQSVNAQINYRAEDVKKVVLYQTDNIDEIKKLDLSNDFKIDKDTFWLAFLTFLCLY